MKYEVRLGGKTFEVEVDGETVHVGGRATTARIVTIPGSPLRRVAVDGLSRTYAMSRSKEGWEIQFGGRTWAAEVADERAQSLRRMVGQKKVRGDGGVVRAPMPGLVVRIEVEVGQSVTAGAGLVVLEAMKMENEIRALTAGVVKEIHVRPGQAVEKGTVLVLTETPQG